MLPLKDNIPAARCSFVNYALIIANIAVFVYEVSLGPRLALALERYALVPAALTHFQLQNFTPNLIIPFFSHMFLHGSLWHLVGNMLFLYIFGDNVEDYLGHGRYLLFYLFCGLGAALSHVYQLPASTAPMLGASGAIAGVLGAYFILYPKAQVLTLIPVFLFFKLIEVPAFFFLALWFAMQTYSGFLGAEAGVAWWGHIGGFLSGILLLFLLRQPQKKR